MPNQLTIPSAGQRLTHDPTVTLNGDPMGFVGDNPYGEMTDELIFGGVNTLLGWIDDATGLDLLGVVTPLEAILGADTGLLSGLMGWLTPGLTPAVAGSNVLSPIMDILGGALSGSSAGGFDLLNVQMLMNSLSDDLTAVYQLANGAWSFAQQSMVAVAQIAQQAIVAPIYSAWEDVVNAFQFWTFGWFTNTYAAQQQTTTNTSDIGVLFAHINPATASIYYAPKASIALNANYVGPDGTVAPHPSFTTLSGVTPITKAEGFFGGDFDFAARSSWFTGNPMNDATDHGLITDAYHVETKIAGFGGYGTSGLWVNGNVVGTTLGQHLAIEIQTQVGADILTLSTFTSFNSGRVQRFAVQTGNGMNRFAVGDVLAVEHDGRGHFSAFLNGVALKPDAALNEGWDDVGAVMTHGAAHREFGVAEYSNGPKLGPIRAYDIAASVAASVIAPVATIGVNAPTPRINGKIAAPPALSAVNTPPPLIAGGQVPTPTGVLPMGFSEQQQQLATTPADFTNMQRMYDEATTLRPKYWRIMAPWNLVVKAQSPGTAAFDSTYNVPTSSNRDWTWIDKCLNDILLTGAQVVMIVGQGRPSGTWVNASTYGDFSAEVASRYKPGGPGIRTDGKYSVNAGKGVSIYECWNEQNQTTFWGKTVDPKEYTDYLRFFHDKIKAVPGLGGTSSLILYGGMQHITRNDYAAFWTWAGLPEIDFLNQCWSYEPNLGNYFDVMCEHIYPQSDTSAWAPGGDTAVGPAPDLGIDNFRQLQAIRDLMVAKGVGSKPIWITEAGESNNTLSEALSNTYIQSIYSLLVGLGYVKALMWYNIRNTGTDPNKDVDNFGFEDNAFRHKPVWNWMASFANVFPPAAHVATVAPVPVILDVVKPGAALVNTAAPAPLLVNPIIAPPAVVTVSAPTPHVLIIPPAAQITCNAPTPSIPRPAPAAIVSTAAPVPVIVDVVKPLAAVVNTAAPVPAAIVDVVTAPVAQVNTDAPIPQVVGSILPPAAQITTAAPAPILPTAIVAPAAIVNVAAPVPAAIVDVVTAPVAQVNTAAPAPIVGVAIVAPPATVATAAPSSITVIDIITSPAAQINTAVVTPIVIDVVKPLAAVVNTAAPNPVTIIDIITSPAAVVNTAGPTPTIVDKVTVPAPSGITTSAPAPVIFTPKYFWSGVAPQFSGIGVGYESIVSNAVIPGNATEGYEQVPLSDACTVTSLTAWVTNAPGAGNSWVFTLRSNAADTAATVTISGAGVTTATWNGSVSLSQLDLVAMKTSGTGSPAASGIVYWAITYTCNAGQLLPATNFLGASVSSGTLYNPPFGGTNTTPVGTATTMEVLIPTACTVTRIAALDTVNGVPTGPGSGNTNTYTVVNNTGAATSAFSAAIVGTATKAVSGSGAALSFSAGDRLITKEVKGPASAWGGVATCLTVVPTTAGEQIQPFGNLAAPSTTAVGYETPNGYGNNGWNATETAVAMKLPACTIKKLYVNLVTAPASGKSRAFTVRSNAADTSLVATVSNTATTANDTTDTVTHGAGNLFSIKQTPTSTPTATAGVKLGMVLVPT